MKIVLIVFITLSVIWAALRITGLTFFRIPTASMEDAVPVGTLIMAWKKNFAPERFEIIIYHNPDFDTVLIPTNPIGFYAAKRQFGAEAINKQYQKKYIPLAKREQWLGRCVGLPGDKVLIKNAALYINSEIYTNEFLKKLYLVKMINNQPINTKFFERLMINPEDVYRQSDSYVFPATKSQVNYIVQNLMTDTSHYFTELADKLDNMIFPYDSSYVWNRDYFGELEVPRKGKSIKLTFKNISIYKRLIEAFEGNTLSIKDSAILVNGNVVDSYIPKKNYYFICNDNRDNSFDSRYFGFLPDDHISCKVLKMFK